jgi:hypothetical protein
MSHLPSPLSGDNFEEIRRSTEEKGDLARKMMREQLKRGADEYIRLVGREKVREQADVLSACIATMNGLTGSTVRLSIPAVDAMIVAIGMIPQRVDMRMAKDPKFADTQLLFHAIKRLLEIERDEQISRAKPEL